MGKKGEAKNVACQGKIKKEREKNLNQVVETENKAN